MLPAIKKRRLTLLACLAALLGGCQAEKDACPTLTGPGMECWKGIGECRRMGHYVCDPERDYAVCGAVPGKPAAEVCDGLDNDCDVNFDEDFDADHDTFTTCGTRTTSGESVVTDCDGKFDEDFDVDHDTYTTCGTRTTTGELVTIDCDDGSAEINPGMKDICNLVDDDCDGETDGQPDADDSCSDDFFCNGREVCESGTCKHADTVPCPWWPCDEDNEICMLCTSDAECDEWFRRPPPLDHPDCTSFVCVDGICDSYLNLGKQCDDGVDCAVGVCVSDGVCDAIENYEGSQYDDICRDGIDNDCDGLTDYEEPECCIPDCNGVECGDGGCRDQQFACGTCPATGVSCVAGQCRPTGLEWVDIPWGTFMMGSPEGVGDDDEHPQHEVTVQSFEMLRTEVTVAQYLDCVEAGACTEPLRPGDCIDQPLGCARCDWTVPGRENHPVMCLTWYQAVDYCNFVGGRLPSEAEWEYAARSGGQDITYPWGNEAATCDRAVTIHCTCSAGLECPVCSKPAGNTAQGLCDMAGNVWEWMQDWHHESYDGAPVDGSSWEDPPGHARVIRGGARDDSDYNARAVNREAAATGVAVDSIGFRCARDLSP